MATLIRRLPNGFIILSFVSLFSVIFGFLREATIAYYFGVSAEVDTFLAALTIPKILATNFSQLTLAVILPLYVGYRQSKQDAEATALMQKWFWLSSFAISIICLVLFAEAKPLMNILAPGFSAIQSAQAAGWMRMLLPYIGLFGVAGVFTVVLNTNNRFFVAAVSNQLTSITVIIACIIAAHQFGATVLAIGFLIGGIIGFMWQMLNSRRFEPELPSVRVPKVSTKIPFVTCLVMAISYFAQQADTLVDRAFASGISDGSIAAYSYAQSINAIPSSIVTSAIGTSLFPVLSRMTSSGNYAGALRKARHFSAALCSVGVLPVLSIVFFREEIVSLVFQRGAFDQTGVKMTAEVLSIMASMILIQMVRVLFTLLLFSSRKNWVVAGAAVVQLTVKLIVSSFLVTIYGLWGLALSTVIAAAFSTVIVVVVSHTLPKNEQAIVSSL